MGVLPPRYENGHPAILSGVYGEEKPGRVPQKNSCVVSFVILVEVVGFCESCNPPVLGWAHETTNLVQYRKNNATTRQKTMDGGSTFTP